MMMTKNIQYTSQENNSSHGVQVGGWASMCLAGDSIDTDKRTMRKIHQGKYINETHDQA